MKLLGPWVHLRGTHGGAEPPVLQPPRTQQCPPAQHRSDSSTLRAQRLELTTPGVCSTRLNAGLSLLMPKQDPPPCIISSLLLTKAEKETQGEDSEP